MTATCLAAGYLKVSKECWVCPTYQQTLEVLTLIEGGNETWDTLLNKGYSNDTLVFIKNMHSIIECSGSLFSHWVRIRTPLLSLPYEKRKMKYEEAYTQYSSTFRESI